MARHFLSHFIFHSLFDLFPQCCQTGASLGEISVFEIIDCTKEIKFIRRWGGMKVIYSYTLFVKMCNDDLSSSLHSTPSTKEMDYHGIEKPYILFLVQY